MSEFEISRSATIEADPGRVHALVNDFHEWTAWSPWEDVDPALERTYSGPASGTGAHYAWSGNRRAGQGNMEITSSVPERIGIRLAFLKPWKATNDVTFTFVPSAAGTGTDVTWTMTGEHKGFGVVIGKLFNMDKLVGKDFEKGLARLKVAAEG
ncbi:SRPBCC family protein [Nocardioides sp. LS1]|uniref:SRPBCC family protein n=1 Tax=Nocardioides sp. LS1 TaxID=1027620 RepID=UPI000F621719|nr:SRPBCC family protein [Nocardioides sp. LS1]GCD92305.1 polyketide cyclase [Nocardioides sp. LS1]